MKEKEAVELLKKYAPDKKTFQLVLQHARTVQQVAFNLAQAIIKKGYPLDLETIRLGALLHDIGRFKCPPKSPDSVRHGYLGGRILRKEGLPKYARIAERHLGAGLAKEEIISQKLPLPKKDFLPETKEEKIVCYADKLIIGDRVGRISQAVGIFKKTLPYSAVERLIKLHEEIEGWLK